MLSPEPPSAVKEKEEEEEEKAGEEVAEAIKRYELDPEAIAAYLMLGHVPGPMTPLREVRKLEPGERLVVANGEARLERCSSAQDRSYR